MPTPIIPSDLHDSLTRFAESNGIAPETAFAAVRQLVPTITEARADSAGAQPAAVPARLTPDDQTGTYHFDAAEWLRSAPLGDLRALVQCEFGGDYGADEVALALEHRTASLTAGFAYLVAVPYQQNGDRNGFEVHVDGAAAMAFLEAERPEIAATLREAFPNQTEFVSFDA